MTISNARFVIRQGNAYCYGSGASTAIGASTNTLTFTQFGLVWKATFENNTNVTNNSPIGVMILSGLKVTFS